MLLASVYHTVLFAHNRLRLIGFYALYLWGTFFYCLYRCVYFAGTPTPLWPHLNLDEELQMVSFALYIRFTKVAMEVDRAKDPLAYWFCINAPIIVLLYIAAERLSVYAVTHFTQISPVYLFLYLGIRVFLLIVGMTGLYVVMRKRKNTYFAYISLAIMAVITAGLLSTVTHVFANNSLGKYSLSILMIGFTIDVCFFSAAVSLKMRTETLDKETANRRVLEKETNYKKVKLHGWYRPIRQRRKNVLG